MRDAFTYRRFHAVERRATAKVDRTFHLKKTSENQYAESIRRDNR